MYVYFKWLSPHHYAPPIDYPYYTNKYNASEERDELLTKKHAGKEVQASTGGKCGEEAMCQAARGNTWRRPGATSHRGVRQCPEGRGNTWHRHSASTLSGTRCSTEQPPQPKTYLPKYPPAGLEESVIPCTPILTHS
mmetsp:Transcript_150472/g.262933  ORF Transcript_150472/g.262933 Transcript_150472/m.262933 type:complete len:137 (-) Transcript_150472:114-524(-)